MENKMTVRIFCLLAAFLGGCGGDAVGIFKAINAETKLNSDPSAPGNILSIVQYGSSLYAAGGNIYRKDKPTAKGGWLKDRKPKGLVVRLAAGYSEDNEYLYALTAKTDSKGSTEYELWYTSKEEPKDWKRHNMRTENLRTIFSNHAVSTENRAYATTSEGVFQLNGDVARQITMGEVSEGVYSVADSDDAVASCIAAAYIGSEESGRTYFADTTAFASDGTYLFKGDGIEISYGNTALLNHTEIEGINNAIMSLWAHKKTETETKELHEGTLYIGTKYGGVKQAAYTVDDTGTLKFDEAKYLGNAYAVLDNYDIPVVFATAGGKAVYASTVGYTAAQGTKKNGLWGCYPGEREIWDRE